MWVKGEIATKGFASGWKVHPEHQSGVQRDAGGQMFPGIRGRCRWPRPRDSVWGCDPGGLSGRDVRDSGGCKDYVLCGMQVLSPAPPNPQRLDFYLSHLINPGSRLCLFTAYDYYLCFSSNIVSALKGNEHKGKYLTFSLLKFH